MRTVLQTFALASAGLFGACAGAVVGMVACLVLRDGVQLEMPLSRIAVLASGFALVGAVANLLVEGSSIRSQARRRKAETDDRVDSSTKQAT